MDEREQFKQDSYNQVKKWIKLTREICTGTSMEEEEADMLTSKAVDVFTESDKLWGDKDG